MSIKIIDDDEEPLDPEAEEAAFARAVEGAKMAGPNESVPDSDEDDDD